MDENTTSAVLLSPEAIGVLAQQVQQVLAEATTALGTANDLLDRLQAARSEIESQRLEIQSRAAELHAALADVASVRDGISAEQAEIATKSAHIQAALDHAANVRLQLDSLYQSASESQAGTASFLAQAQASSASVSELHSQTLSYKDDAEAQLAAALQAAEAARSAMATAKNLAARSDTIEQRIDAYEAKLSELQTSSAAQLETIQGLLPGATAAGLASAFDKRRQSFLMPARRWQWLFVGALGALVLLALSGLWHIYKLSSPLTWDELARLWLARFPIAGALIWLALHASRESALAKRLEEDYGYKAAIAASFQGFQKQMAEIDAGALDGSPLAKLCQDTLSTLADPPGRIYDKHKLVVTPAADLGKAAAEVVAQAGRGT